MLCAIWHHLYKFKYEKNTHGGVLLLVLKIALLHGYFLRFLNYKNDTKSCKASQLNQILVFLNVKLIYKRMIPWSLRLSLLFGNPADFCSLELD